LPVDNQKIYLKTLANQSGEHPTSYILSMQEYDTFLFSTYHFKIADLKRKPLKAYQIHVLKRLNPSEFDLQSWREEGIYDDWLAWFSKIRKITQNGQFTLFDTHKSDEIHPNH